MSNNQLQDSDRKHQEEEDAYATNRTDPGRARPMTSTVTHGSASESKRLDSRSGAQGYNSNEKFPTLDNHNRAISAKAGKLSETRKHSESRKGSSKPSQSARLYDAPVKTQNFVLQNNKIMLGPNSNEFARIKPKNIMQDKERLYEETLHLKQLVNTLKEENLKQKTKMNNLEKEAAKFERMIQDSNAMSHRDAGAGKTAEGHLSITLKQNVKELKTDLKKRDDELLEIKKTMKYTKIQELEMQMKAFQDESLRLKTVMDHVLQEKAHVVLSDDDKNKLQEEYFVQATQLKTLKRDNEEMATAIKILEEQNFEYEKKITELEKKLKREQNAHKKALQDKDKEIMRLRTEAGGSGNIQSVLAQSGSSKRPVTSLNRDDALRQELEKKTIENNNFLNQLAEKRNQVLTLERQLRDLRAEYNEKITSTQNEKQALLRELDKLRNVKAVGLNDHSKDQPVTSLRVQELKLDDYARRASFQRPFTVDEKDSPHMYNVPSGQTSTFSDRNQQKGGPKKRVQKVRPENMKNIGHELNLRLRIKKLTFADIDRSIWPEKVRKTGTVNVKEMIDILKGEPFNMTNEDEVVLTARFLIEDNEHEYLFYDENAKNDLHIVKSILKKVVGNLPPWDEARAREMHQEISEICVTHYGGLKENLKVLCKSGFLTAEDLKKACNVIEITLSDEQIEYIITKLFEHSDNIHKLSIDRLFEVFTLKPKDIPREEGYIKTLVDPNINSRKKIIISEEDDEYKSSSRGHTLEQVEHVSEVQREEEYEDDEEEEENGEEEGEEPEQKGGRISEKPGEEEDP